MINAVHDPQPLQGNSTGFKWKGLFLATGLILLFLAGYVVYERRADVLKYIPGAENLRPLTLQIPNNSLSTTTRSQIPFDTQELEQGVVLEDVIVRYADLYHQFSLLYVDTPENRTDLAKWQEAADNLSTLVIYQHEGQKAGIFGELPANEPQNFDIKRAYEAKTYLENEASTALSGEVLSFWFFNVEEPAMGLPAAKAKMAQVAQEFHSKVTSGELSFQEAEAEIGKMTELEEIDPAYQRNAYFEFTHYKPNEVIFYDPEATNYAWQLDKDQISNVIVVEDYDREDNQWYEAHFSIIHITDKVESEFNTAEEIVAQRKNEGFQLVLNAKDSTTSQP